MSTPHFNRPSDLIIFCRELTKAIVQRDWSSVDPSHKREFEGSVRFSSSVFNVTISMLPGIVLKMAEYVGFTSDRVS